MKKFAVISIVGGVLLGAVVSFATIFVPRAEAEEPPPPLPSGFNDDLVRDIAQQSGLEEATVRADLAKPDLVPYYRDTYIPSTGTGPLPAGTGPEGGTAAGTAGAQPPKPQTASPAQEAETNCLGSGFRAAVSAFTGRAFECMAAWTANIAMWISARGLWMAGLLLNYTLDTTLNLSTLLSSLPIVDIGWQVLRDVSNIVFIFIALWSGISIIIGINPERAWGLLGHMVLVALFVNFSLFITKTVVDVSNVAALHFYNRIVDPATRNDADGGLTNAFMNAMKLGTLYNTKLAAQSGTDAGLYLRSVGGGGETQLGFTNIILIGIFGSIFMIVAGFVFFAAAILFIIRTVTLVMLMILSPLAFVALLLPGASGMAHEWWHKLWSQSFFAPLYLALASIVVRAINSNAFQGFLSGSAENTGATFASAITGYNAGSIHIVFSFILLIGLMVGCLLVAQSLGAKGSKMTMEAWGGLKHAGTGLVAGGTGMLARTVLRGGETLANSDFIKKRVRPETLAKMKKWSVRSLDERWEQKGGMFGGQGAIGKFLREKTTSKLVKAKIGGKSVEEAHKESKEMESDRHNIALVSQIRGNSHELDGFTDGEALILMQKERERQRAHQMRRAMQRNRRASGGTPPAGSNPSASAGGVPPTIQPSGGSGNPPPPTPPVVRIPTGTTVQQQPGQRRVFVAPPPPTPPASSGTPPVPSGNPPAGPASSGML